MVKQQSGGRQLPEAEPTFEDVVMRIAQLAPPVEAMPPKLYGGIEREHRRSRRPGSGRSPTK